MRVAGAGAGCGGLVKVTLSREESQPLLMRIGYTGAKGRSGVPSALFTPRRLAT